MKGKTQGEEKVLSFDLNKIIAIAVVIVAAVFAIISVTLIVRSFMRVGEIAVTGYSSYDREDVISASGIKLKDKLYSVDKDEVEKKIMRDCRSGYRVFPRIRPRYRRDGRGAGRLPRSPGNRFRISSGIHRLRS